MKKIILNLKDFEDLIYEVVTKIMEENNNDEKSEKQKLEELKKELKSYFYEDKFNHIILQENPTFTLKDQINSIIDETLDSCGIDSNCFKHTVHDFINETEVIYIYNAERIMNYFDVNDCIDIGYDPNENSEACATYLLQNYLHSIFDKKMNYLEGTVAEYE